MKILVTGGAGFIGSHIVDALIKKGHQVIIIDNLVTGQKKNLHPKAKFYQVDIRSPKIAEIFQKEKPQIVYHCAAQINLRKSIEDPIYDTKVNILGSLNILQNFIRFCLSREAGSALDSIPHQSAPLQLGPRQSALVLLINLVGRVFTKVEDYQVSCPFKKADEILAKFPEIKVKIVDFHAEATSEKNALRFYLDGRVSLVVGTHTHVQTADEQILPSGTAYISDLGMVGAKDSVIGVEKQRIINHFLLDELYEPVEIEIPKKGIAIVNGVFVEIDEKTGKAKKIERIKKETII